MKTFGKDILISVLLGVVLPAMVLSVFLRTEKKTVTDSPTETSLSIGVLDGIERERIHIPVLRDHGEIQTMELEEYLCGVILAEMPVDFEPEALKSQAVVSRTYALRRYSKGTKHPQGAVCTDPSCCQGYMTEEEFENRGGVATDILKVSQAVQATAGEVLMYRDELIDATYFSCSGGRTEDAQSVWGSDVAYLQAVDSPGEDAAAYHTDETVFTPEQIEQALSLNLTGEPDHWFRVLSLTDGNGVKEIDICGYVFTGVEVRKALGLRSSAFSVIVNDSDVIFQTKGYGHRVGMSQYGADAMALSGSSYDQILAHYYQGTKLTQYHQND